MNSAVGKQAWLTPLVVSTAILGALPVRGQGPPAQPGDVKAVVRISKQLIDEVAAREEVVASIPFNAVVLGFCCQGVIEGRGTLSVDLTTSPDGATFAVTGRGAAHSYARGIRGPIVVTGPVGSTFTSRTLVRFDGQKFSRVSTTPCADVYVALDAIEGRHGGPVGRAAGCVVRPLGQLLVPRAEKQARPIGEYFLVHYVDELAQDIVARLNRSTRVEESLNRLFPETRGWVFQITADSALIQSAYGPPGIAAPVLPPNPKRPANVRLELWLHTTTKDAQSLAKLANEPLAKQLVQRYLEATLPELAALTEDRTVTAIGPWIVISIGAPKAEAR